MLQHFGLNRQQKSRHYIAVREGERARIVRARDISLRFISPKAPRACEVTS